MGVLNLSSHCLNPIIKPKNWDGDGGTESQKFLWSLFLRFWDKGPRIQIPSKGKAYH